MGFGSFLKNFATGGLYSLFKSDAPKADPYQSLLNQLNPLIQAQTNATTQSTQAGLTNTNAAVGNLNYVSDYFKKIMGETSDDELLKLLDASGITKNIDENTQQVAEAGVRGGARSAVLGGASFSRDAFLNRALQELRNAAPDKIAQIAQSIGNIGLGQMGAGTSAGSLASQDLFGIEGLRQQDKARKTELLGSIFEAIGSAIGLAACVTLDTPILTPTGYKKIEDLHVGDKVLSFSLDEIEEVVERTIIRERLADAREVISIAQDANHSAPLRATVSHEFFTDKTFGSTASVYDLNSGDFLPRIIDEQTLAIIEKPIKIVNEAIKPVKWIKLDDEENNYPVITGIYLSVDDDCLVEN